MTRITMSVKNLKEIADLLNTVVTETKLKLDNSGISIKAVDPSHVAMISMDVPKESLTEYSLEREEELAVDVERLKSVLKVARDSDEITMNVEKDKIAFEIGAVVKKINLLDGNSVTIPRIPKIGAESYVVITKQDFDKGLRAAEDVSDSIRLTLSPTEFKARSSSESEESELVLPREMLKEIKCEGSVKSSYPIEYLIKFTRALQSCDEFKLSFRDDYPLTIDFKFGKDSLITGAFYLAPRMEE
ncbi:MAG: DNA polymerase sliding clamp [Candidatus Thermoplasmatota archaeon]|nr:DNA polymerase sliding clamp [Candidatus Thermoplasmatota archaeon]MCL5731388.1 DNA polymerase sliding clamp [Candidatus Thermoplasmatota archaeon]